MLFIFINFHIQFLNQYHLDIIENVHHKTYRSFDDPNGKIVGSIQVLVLPL